MGGGLSQGHSIPLL